MPLVYELAELYAAETDAYDRLVCRHGKPESGKQLAIVSEHAWKLNDRCERICLAAGFTRADWNRARIRCVR
jgi:hypothetical protein